MVLNRGVLLYKLLLILGFFSLVVVSRLDAAESSTESILLKIKHSRSSESALFTNELDKYFAVTGNLGDTSSPSLTQIYQTVGTAILKKILEDQAHKNNSSMEAHPRVVDYIFKAILIEGANLSLADPKQSMDYHSAYEVLKKRVALLEAESPHSTQLVLNTDWLYQQNASSDLNRILETDQGSGPPGLALNLTLETPFETPLLTPAFYLTLNTIDSWPPLAFIFRKKGGAWFLPEKLEDFYQEVKSFLNSEHRKIAYKNILLNMLLHSKKVQNKNNITHEELADFIFTLFKAQKFTLTQNQYSHCPVEAQSCIENALKNPELLINAMFSL